MTIGDRAHTVLGMQSSNMLEIDIQIKEDNWKYAQIADKSDSPIKQMVDRFKRLRKFVYHKDNLI